MKKKESFEIGQHTLQKMYSVGKSDEEYMSDISNWLCVHVTVFLPQKSASGNLFIQTTAMATKNEIPRATVHFTLNQVVASHMSGNWDDTPYVVLAPYDAVVKLNGSPQMVATEDTYFIPNPDTGLLLPADTYLVRPDEKTLFTVGDNVSTYKSNNYTAAEIKTILELEFVKRGENRAKRDRVERYSRNEITDGELQNILSNDEVLNSRYKQAADKSVIRTEICRRQMYSLLNKLLRDAVIVMTMDKMGYRYVVSQEDTITDTVAKTAEKSGVAGCSGSKHHSASPEKMFETTSYLLQNLLSMLSRWADAPLTGSDNVYSILVDAGGSPHGTFVIQNMLRGTKPDFYKFYRTQFDEYYFDESQRAKPGSIREYNSRLDTVLHRHCERLNREYALVLDKLNALPEYAELKQRLRHRIEEPELYKIDGRLKQEPETEEDSQLPEDSGEIEDWVIERFFER